MEIDIHNTDQVWDISAEMYRLSKDYAKAIEKSAEYKHQWDVFLALYMPKIRLKKNNAGFDLATILMLEIAISEGNKAILEAHENLTKEKGKADGLEKVIDALKTQISLYQSIARTLPK